MDMLLMIVLLILVVWAWNHKISKAEAIAGGAIILFFIVAGLCTAVGVF